MCAKGKSFSIPRDEAVLGQSVQLMRTTESNAEQLMSLLSGAKQRQLV